MRGTPGGLADVLACRELLGQMSVFSPGAASRLAGRFLLSVAKPVSAEPIALRGCGARRLYVTPKMGDTTVDEGHCEEQPAEVLGASGLC